MNGKTYISGRFVKFRVKNGLKTQFFWTSEMNTDEFKKKTGHGIVLKKWYVVIGLIPIKIRQKKEGVRELTFLVWAIRLRVIFLRRRVKTGNNGVYLCVICREVQSSLKRVLWPKRTLPKLFLFAAFNIFNINKMHIIGMVRISAFYRLIILMSLLLFFSTYVYYFGNGNEQSNVNNLSAGRNLLRDVPAMQLKSWYRFNLVPVELEINGIKISKTVIYCH